jgi:diguanylate cyclase (GGDEF)-like protein
MAPEHITYSAVLLLAGITCLVVAAVVWQQSRGAAGAPALIVMMLGLAWWDVTYAIFWAGTPGPTPYFWLDITYVGVVTVPAAFFAFALQFSRREHLLRPPLLAALVGEPIFVLLMLFTDPLHGLFFAGKRALNTGMILEAGPVFWANVAYSYLLVLIACMLLVLRFIRSSGLYRQQAALVLLGVGITWASSLIFVFGYNPLPDADNTPFSFSLTALAFAFAVLRYRLLDVVPIARDALIERMSDGVIVIDARGRIVDINPAAQSVVRVFFPDSPIGRPALEVLAPWANIASELSNHEILRTEIVVGAAPERFLDVRISPLLDRRERYVGRLIVWRDITDLKRAQTRLAELATIDELTQVYNRRHALELAGSELRRARRLDHPFAIVLADIDHFKEVNDRFGHPAGDQVLIAFARICRSNIRETDVFARFGGEEFIILMPETDADQAWHVTERLRAALAATCIPLGDEALTVRASFGIAVMENHHETLDAILQRADQALYTAKESGRNRIVVG